jgi:ankyrin repeat protein
LDITQYCADEDGEDEGECSLHAAAEEGNIDVVKSLPERGVDINGRNAGNRTPLHRAAVKGNLDVVRLLVERGAEVDSRNSWGWTLALLHDASRFGHPEVSRVLVDHGADVNERTRSHWTPIHFSVTNEHLGLVKLLLEGGADVHAVNGEGQTSCQLSLRTGNREIAELLREHGTCRVSKLRRDGSKCYV